MELNRVTNRPRRRDDVMDLIQDFDAIALKLAASTTRHQRYNQKSGPVLYLTAAGQLVPARRSRVPRHWRLAKSIVIGAFMVAAAAFGALIA